jgi:hypothetical protein
VTYQEGRAFAEDQGVGLFFETALATSADDTRLLVSVGEHLYARAVSRREKEQAKEQALMMLADAMEVGWFERVELEKLEEALEAAIMAGVDEDALKPAQEKAEAAMKQIRDTKAAKKAGRLDNVFAARDIPSRTVVDVAPVLVFSAAGDLVRHWGNATPWEGTKVRARRQQQRRPARHASQALKAALTGTSAVSWRPH